MIGLCLVVVSHASSQAGACAEARGFLVGSHAAANAVVMPEDCLRILRVGTHGQQGLRFHDVTKKQLYVVAACT